MRHLPITKEEVWNTAKSLYRRMTEPYYQGVAAELSFFFLLSMVPLSLVTAELLGVFSLSTDLLTSMAGEYVSEEITGSLARFLKYQPSGTMNLLFLGIALWSASKAQFSMIRIANYTFTGESKGHGFVRERVRSMITVFLTIALLVFSLVILVYGEPLVRAVGFYLDRMLAIPLEFNRAWYLLRWPVGIAFFLFVVSLVFYLLPTRRIPYKNIIPGSVVTSAGMMVATWAYSYYTANFARYDVLYGSLGSIIGFMMWFYLLGYIFVVGIVLNSILFGLRGREAGAPK